MPEVDEPENPRFILEFDPKTGGFKRLIMPGIPVFALVNQLWVSLMELGFNQIAQQKAQEQKDQAKKIVVASGNIPKTPWG
jgi:hypothetical protein